MKFKTALGISDTSWVGIGKHLGELVNKNLDNRKGGVESLAQQLEIPHHYLSDYINPTTDSSLGIFFSQVAEILNISTADIFKHNSDNHYTALQAYLSTFCSESFMPFLNCKSLEEFSQHVSAVLNESRGELIKKPIHFNPSLEVPLIESLKPCLLSHDYPTEQEIKKTRVEGNLAYLPTEYWDRILTQDLNYLNQNPITIKDWEMMYKKGDFSNVPNTPNISTLLCRLNLKADTLIPLRSLTDPERYELFIRWKENRGDVVHGTKLDDQGNLVEKIPTYDEKSKYGAQIAMLMVLVKNFSDLMNNQLQLVDDYLYI